MTEKNQLTPTLPDRQIPFPLESFSDNAARTLEETIVSCNNSDYLVNLSILQPALKPLEARITIHSLTDALQSHALSIAVGRQIYAKVVESMMNNQHPRFSLLRAEFEAVFGSGQDDLRPQKNPV